MPPWTNPHLPVGKSWNRKKKGTTPLELAAGTNGEWHIQQHWGYRNRLTDAGGDWATGELLAASWRKVCIAQDAQKHRTVGQNKPAGQSRPQQGYRRSLPILKDRYQRKNEKAQEPKKNNQLPASRESLRELLKNQTSELYTSRKRRPNSYREAPKYYQWQKEPRAWTEQILEWHRQGIEAPGDSHEAQFLL